MDKMFLLKTSFVILSVLVASNAGKSVPESSVTNVKFSPEPPPPNDNTTTTSTTAPTPPITTPSTKPPPPTTKPTPKPTPEPTPKPTPHPGPSPNTTTVAPTTPSPAPTKPTTPVPPTTPHTTVAPPAPDTHKFDGPSFIGGIVLTIGLTAIGFVSYKFYKARTDGSNYHTL